MMNVKFSDEIFQLHKEFEKFMNHVQGTNKPPAGFSNTNWVPLVNLYEKEDEYIIIIELPGVDPDKMRLSFEENKLEIEGIKEPPANYKYGKCQHMEIAFGSFSRPIKFDGPIDSQNIQATYHQGFLIIKVPKKREDELGKIIAIQSE